MDFSDPEEQELVNGILSELDVREKLRVVRCVLFAAAGNIGRLRELEKLAKMDYRDVIMAGEYDSSDKKIRDFNEPF